MKLFFYRKICFFLCLICIACTCADAQEKIYPQENTDPLKQCGSNSSHSHFVTKAAWTVAYTGLCFLSYKFIDPDLQEDTQERLTPFEARSARLISPLGLGKMNWIECGAVAATAYLTKTPSLKKLTWVWAGGLVINDFTTNQLKELFQRHRPSSGDRYNVFDGPRGPKINKSFPSAHTSNAFTTATAFATVYKNKKWVAPLAYSLASLVGISRIYNNAHWASDVMVGAGVGFLSTKLSYYFVEKVIKAENKHHERVKQVTF